MHTHGKTLVLSIWNRYEFSNHLAYVKVDALAYISVCIHSLTHSLTHSLSLSFVYTWPSVNHLCKNCVEYEWFVYFVRETRTSNLFSKRFILSRCTLLLFIDSARMLFGSFFPTSWYCICCRASTSWNPNVFLTRLFAIFVNVFHANALCF